MRFKGQWLLRKETICIAIAIGFIAARTIYAGSLEPTMSISVARGDSKYQLYVETDANHNILSVQAHEIVDDSIKDKTVLTPGQIANSAAKPIVLVKFLGRTMLALSSSRFSRGTGGQVQLRITKRDPIPLTLYLNSQKRWILQFDGKTGKYDLTAVVIYLRGLSVTAVKGQSPDSSTGWVDLFNQ